MSSQRGNVSRSRPQKYKNKTVFKNDLHDTSHTIKKINKIEIANVCAHCKNVLEWKIKYKKYKPLKAPSTCVKCHEKCVKEAYHTICTSCAIGQGVCPKCGVKSSDCEMTPSFNSEILKTPEYIGLVKSLSERRRRTLFRFVEKMKNDPDAENTILSKLKQLTIDDGKSSFMVGDDLDLSGCESSKSSED